MKRTGTPRGDQAHAGDAASMDDFAPGSSRQQDALVGPLSHDEAMRIAAKRLITYRFIHWVLRLPIRFILRVKRHGAEHVPRRGGAILVMNHVSSFDPPVLLVSLKRPFITLAKAGILARPIKRFFVETLGGMIRVDRSHRHNQAAVEAACAAVHHGKLLAVWPEGGRSPTGRLTRAHTGVARIALQTGAPVIPVAAEGTYRLKAKHAAKIRWGTPVTLRFGPPLRFPDRANEADDRQAVRDVSDRIMLEVARLLGDQEVEHYRRLMERDVPPGKLDAAARDEAPSAGGEGGTHEGERGPEGADHDVHGHRARGLEALVGQ